MSELIPYVIEKTPAGERSYDIFSRLLKDRIVMLTGEVSRASCNILIAQMLFLESEDPKADILLYIDSPGGALVPGYAVIDTMSFIECDVQTIVVGEACSMGSLIAASGTKGKRKMLTHATHMIHQVSGGIERSTTIDINIHAKETTRWNNELVKTYSEITGKTAGEIKKDIERDNFMTASESIKYGLADEIISKR